MRRRILIVDDDRDLRAIFASALAQDGYDTELAENAQAAMALVVGASPPDAILLDFDMPFVNGLGFLYRLRKAQPQIPVAIITGCSNLDDATVEQIRDLGVVLRFKPLTIAEVQAVAGELLAAR